MIRQEAILQSPLRILDRRIRGGLGKGRLGVIVAPAGVGKSAVLVQLGLDALLRGRPVLHVALGQPVEHVSARYDAFFEELADRVDLADRRGVHEMVSRQRLIWSAMDGGLGVRTLDEALAAFQAHLGCTPATLLVDGFAWAGPRPDVAGTLAGLKASAARAGAELWMTARSAPGRPPCEADPDDPAAPPERCGEQVDVILSLVPQGRGARVRLLRDLDGSDEADLPLVVEGGSLRYAGGEDEDGGDARGPEAFTLLAGGSAGAEEAFGACAERWGVQEVNFTFAGRPALARTRGLTELTEAELRLGDVSEAYLKAHLPRALAGPAEHRRVLQLIWHQVGTAGEVFAVGALNPDDTAQGGTGWAVELARHWGKPVHVFDQERDGWFRWDGRGWATEAPPVITHPRFAGAGTRALSAAGLEAIRALFERSFGPAPE
ncbi:AAA family ATPase [Anaeromyxobacter sp. PSR-1]|uniref:AAA family ATPase n=1 Tax=unclassified Anaeromyxobacter TaxID=2620896 RepID=UPI0005E7921C|nr:AAA family ATPase [Anaeromyxobacter sp. PSR-1]GAO01190.1 hypothetical protein PSR1_00042 [Anaeromyxobacter sp. PSR-1]